MNSPFKSLLLCAGLIFCSGLVSNAQRYVFEGVESEGLYFTIHGTFEAPDAFVNYATVARNESYTSKGYGLSEVIIPGAVDFNLVKRSDDVVTYPVTSIGTDAFRNNSVLERIVLPYGITSVLGGTFSGCSNLKEVVFTPGSYKELRLYISAFADCPKLENFNLDRQMTFVYDDHSTGFENLKKFTCNGTVSFWSANRERRPDTYPVKPEMQIDWNNANVDILTNGLSWFTGENFVLEPKVKLNCDGGSIGVRHVKTLEIKTSGSNAFSNNMLWNVSTAFSECELEAIILHDDTMLALQDELYFEKDGVRDGITLYVPAELVVDYRNHPIWGTFKTIASTGGVDEMGADDSGAEAVFYDLNGVRVEHPEPGTVVVRKQGGAVSKQIIR